MHRESLCSHALGDLSIYESRRKGNSGWVCEHVALPEFIFSLQFVSVSLLEKAGQRVLLYYGNTTAGSQKNWILILTFITN